MPINIGLAEVTAISIGNVPITAVYLGTDPVWTGAGLGDSFNRPDQLGLGLTWTDHGPAVQPFLASVYNHTARINMPSDSTGTQTSSWRYNAAQSGGDDGWIEVRVMSGGGARAGGGDFPTRAMRRLTDSAFTDGVGIELNTGVASIVRLLGSTYEVQQDAGGFQNGDIIRLTQAGNIHTLSINGDEAASWHDQNDSAHSGTGYRSAGLVLTGDSNGESANYSPSIDYFRFT